MAGSSDWIVSLRPWQTLAAIRMATTVASGRSAKEVVSALTETFTGRIPRRGPHRTCSAGSHSPSTDKTTAPIPIHHGSHSFTSRHIAVEGGNRKRSATGALMHGLIYRSLIAIAFFELAIACQSPAAAEELVRFAGA